MQITIVPVGALGTNCYLLKSDGGSCAVVDPGASPAKLLDILEKANLQVRYILLTHGHFDHIGAVSRLAAAYPEAALYIGEPDRELAVDPAKSHGDVLDEAVISRLQNAIEGLELPLDDLTIKVLETPGHTRGGIVYLCRDAMFSGDTLFRGDCGRCDLYGGDYEVMKKSLKKLASLSGPYEVYPGHGESSVLEWERAHNPYMKESLS